MKSVTNMLVGGKVNRLGSSLIWECDVCNFRNVNERDVCWNSEKDVRTLRYIRRVSLDVMWSRTKETVKSIG